MTNSKHFTGSVPKELVATACTTFDMKGGATIDFCKMFVSEPSSYSLAISAHVTCYAHAMHML